MKRLTPEAFQKLEEFLAGEEPGNTYLVERLKKKRCRVYRSHIDFIDEAWRVLYWQIGKEKIVFFVGPHDESEAKMDHPPKRPEPDQIVEWVHPSSRSADKTAPTAKERDDTVPHGVDATGVKTDLIQNVSGALGELALHVVSGRVESEVATLVDLLTSDALQRIQTECDFISQEVTKLQAALASQVATSQQRCEKQLSKTEELSRGLDDIAAQWCQTQSAISQLQSNWVEERDGIASRLDANERMLADLKTYFELRQAEETGARQCQLAAVIEVNKTKTAELSQSVCKEMDALRRSTEEAISQAKTRQLEAEVVLESLLKQGADTNHRLAVLERPHWVIRLLRSFALWAGFRKNDSGRGKTLQSI